jgi:hypothetical protein
MNDVTRKKGMKAMQRHWVALGLVLALTGCSTMTPARYSVSMDNNQALKQYAGSAARLVSLAPPAEYSPNCRLMGPIQASDGMTIPQFVEKAFNDELKFAGVYAENGPALTGTIDHIEFSSTAGLTNGWWDLAWTLKSGNGRSLSVQNRYGFKSGFDAVTACNQTAQALGPAVQDLIRKTVTDARFGELIRQ